MRPDGCIFMLTAPWKRSDALRKVLDLHMRGSN